MKINQKYRNIEITSIKEDWKEKNIINNNDDKNINGEENEKN